MVKKPRIAIMMELCWPYKRHYEIFSGICEYAAENGDWDLDLGDYPQYEIQQGVKYAGIIGRISQNTYTAAKKARIPMVNVWVDSPVASKVAGVHPDFRLAGRMAAEHLITRGLKRLVHFSFKGSAASALHYQGMHEYAKEQGCTCKKYTVSANFAEQEKQWKQFLEYTHKAMSSWQAPIGIGFSSDELAFAVTSIAKNQGWSIPEKLVVIGSNNEVVICNAADPSLSSVDMADKRVGYEAASLLHHLMKGKADKVGASDLIRHVPPKELVLRRSSDAYAVDDPAMVRALAYMSANSHHRISVADIAMASGIGRQSLEHRFRRKLNRTINDELIRLRVSKMKRLLVETQKTIGEISDQVGFGTTANMHVMFRRIAGMTPITYRGKHNPKQKRSEQP